MRYRISTPAAGHSGLVGTVAFANGVAEVDEIDEATERYLRSAGYVIEDSAESPEPEEAPEEAPPTRGRKAAKTEESPA